MPIPSSISDLSTTAGSNSPAGSESPSLIDDYLRTYASYIALLRDQTAFAPQTIASAATTDIGAALSNVIYISGTTTITALGTAAAGVIRTVKFLASLILTHNATSLILENSANITTAANDSADFLSLGSGNWLCLRYNRASGMYSRANILGTVSQSGGVPTGAIVENVVNANGRAIKFADGTMVCVSPQLLCPGPTVVLGALFISPTPVVWTYPATFVGQVPALAGTTANSVQLIVTSLNPNFTTAQFAFYHPISTAGSLTVYAIAVGRWF